MQHYAFIRFGRNFEGFGARCYAFDKELGLWARFRGFLAHCAMVLLGSGAVLRVFGALRYVFTRVGRDFEGFGTLRYGITRVGRVFEGFATLLRARWWDAGEVYASDLIYETSPLGGCRSQGLP
jgi:hypothetical protein